MNSRRKNSPFFKDRVDCFLKYWKESRFSYCSPMPDRTYVSGTIWMFQGAFWDWFFLCLE
jgi:hypothetical protein